MDEISIKHRANLRRLLTLAPALCGSLICSPPMFAQSISEPAGPVGWYRQNQAPPAPQPSMSAAAQSGTAGNAAGQSGPTTPGMGTQQGTSSIGNTQNPNVPPAPNFQPWSTTPSSPSNPLVILDPVNQQDNATAYYDGSGHLQLGRTTPDQYLPDYRQSPFPQQKPATQLPYFGYDYFKPAQDLIDARRSRLERGVLPPQTSMQQYAADNQNTRGASSQFAPGTPPQYMPVTTPTSTPGPISPYGTSTLTPYAPGTASPDLPGVTPPYVSGVPPTYPQSAQPGSTGYQNQPSNGYQYQTPGSTYPGTGGYPSGPGQFSGQQPYGGQQQFSGQQPTGQGAYQAGALAVGASQYNGYSGQSTPGQPTTYGNSNVPGQTGQYPQSGPYGAANYGVSGQQPGYANPNGMANEQFSNPNPNGITPNGQPGPLGQGGMATTGQYGYPNAGQPGIGQQGQTYPFAPGTPSPGQPAGFTPTGVQLDQPQVDIYAGRVAGPLELMSFLPSGNAVPQSYQLASGDVLTVRIWSPTMAPEEMMETVSPTGTITLPGLGNFTVRGQTMDQAEHALRERVRRWYKGGDVSVTLRQQRSMLVTITGDAYLPGSYLVPASQTAYNVLYAAGGPTVDGSLRSIEVRRAGKLVGTLDIYDFLGVGGPSHDIPLQPGDVINIPSRYSSVAVSGEVRKPAIFELKPDENLRDALHFAGGIKASGVSQRVQVNTEDPGTARVLRDIDIHDAAEVAKTALYDGDEVDVFSVRNDVANRVTIEGAVEEQGDYALAPGMKVADLVSRARGVRYNAYTRRADLYRWNADNTLTLVPVDLDKALSGDPKDNIELTRWDRLKVYGRDELTWTAARQVRVRGAVQHEGIYYRSDGMHASDLLRMAGGPLPEAYLNRLILLHQHPDGSFTYDYVNATGWASGDPSSDPLIQNNDVLAVYREDEAHFTADHTVRIDGEVVAPGVYPRGDHMRVSDLVKLAGGFTPRAGLTVLIAHPNKMQAAKTVSLLTDTVSFDGDKVASGKDLELRDGDVVTVQGVGGFHSKVRLVYIDGRVNRPGPVPLTPNMRLSDLIKAAGGLMPDAFVEGAEFERDPALLGTQSQQNVAKLVGNLTDLLNNSDYQRDLALSDAERIQTIQDAAQPDNTSIPIPGLGGSTAAAAASVVSPTVAAQALKQQRELVSPARGMNDPELAPSGNLAVDVADALRHPGSASDVVLAEGDTVVIPTQPTTVEVAGAVFNTRGVVFKPGAGLDYYISESGGYAPDAARDRIEIIHPGGGLVPAYKVHRIEAGDMILVPTKVLAAKIQSHRSTLDDLFKTAVGASVVLRVLGL